MSDLFYGDVRVDFIFKVIDVMRHAHWHTFQVLKKRSARLLELDSRLDWPNNVWMGVSVENQEYTFRIDHLHQTHERINFYFFEPLLGSLPDLNLDGIHWVIVGGESGPKSRPMDITWIVDIREKCTRAKVPFFFKQWGGVNKKKTRRILEGRTWDGIPVPVNA